MNWTRILPTPKCVLFMLPVFIISKGPLLSVWTYSVGLRPTRRTAAPYLPPGTSLVEQGWGCTDVPQLKMGLCPDKSTAMWKCPTPKNICNALTNLWCSSNFFQVKLATGHELSLMCMNIAKPEESNIYESLWRLDMITKLNQKMAKPMATKEKNLQYLKYSDPYNTEDASSS